MLRQQRWQDACVLPDTAKQIEKEADLSSPLPEGNKGEQLKKLYDYDKFIAENDGIYRQWWIMWKPFIQDVFCILKYQKSRKSTDCKQKVICYNPPAMTKYITSTPGIMSGDPVIAGTRIPISRIIYLLSQGYSVKALHRDYP